MTVTSFGGTSHEVVFWDTNTGQSLLDYCSENLNSGEPCSLLLGNNYLTPEARLMDLWRHSWQFFNVGVTLLTGPSGDLVPSGDESAMHSTCSPAGHPDFFSNILTRGSPSSPPDPSFYRRNTKDTVDNSLSLLCTIVLHLSGNIWNEKMQAVQDLEEQFDIVQPANSTLGDVILLLQEGVYVRLEPGCMDELTVNVHVFLCRGTSACRQGEEPSPQEDICGRS